MPCVVVWSVAGSLLMQRYVAARTHLVELRREMLQNQEASISEEELKSKLDNVQVSEHCPLPRRLSCFSIRAREAPSALTRPSILAALPFVPM